MKSDKRSIAKIQKLLGQAWKESLNIVTIADATGLYDTIEEARTRAISADVAIRNHTDHERQLEAARRLAKQDDARFQTRKKERP